jgi:hypothetical protein
VGRKTIGIYIKTEIMNTIEYIRQEAREEGLVEGQAKNQITVVKNMVAAKEFSDEKIASIVGVSVDFVKEVRQGKKK